MDIYVEYVPTSIGHHNQDFYILFDNGEIKQFSIKGYSKTINMSIVEINKTPVDVSNEMVAKDFCFAAGNIGVDQSQSFVVCNNTGIPLEYEWVWINDSVRDYHKGYREKLQEKIEEEKLLHLSTMDRPYTTPADNFGLELPPPIPTPTLVVSRKGRNNTAAESQLMSMTDPFLKSIEHQSNSVIEDEYGITPGHGTIVGEQEFAVSFTPEQLKLVKKRAVLVIKGATYASMPSQVREVQAQHLQHLYERGHGSFHRMRSWIDAIGKVAKVLPYTKSNGDEASIAALVNLITVINLVFNHIISNADKLDVELTRIDRCIRDMLLHVFSFRRNELQDVDDDVEETEVGRLEDETDENGEGIARSISQCTQSNGEGIARSISQCTQSPAAHYTAVLYDWKGGDGGKAPVPVYPIKLQTGKLSKEVPLVGNAKSNSFDFNDDEKELLCEIWLDAETVIQLLGHTISTALDSLVVHEAIDYIQDKARSNIVCLSTLVCGTGKLQSIQVYPPRLFIGGHLSIGRSWHGSVTLKNTSTAMSEVEICTDLKQVILTGSNAYKSFSPEAMLSIAKDVLIEFTPPRILLMPETEATMSVAITIKQLGDFQIEVPLTSSNKHAHLDSVKISCTTSGPSVRFASPEVDLGLIGVGNAVVKTMVLCNHGNVPARYAFNTILDTTEKDTNDIESDGNESSAAAASSSFSIANKTCRIATSPSDGVIQPDERVIVTVTGQAGSSSERVRGKVECKLFDESGSISLPSQYLSVRGEVQSPKTIMYPMKIDLGSVYIDIPVQFLITVENLSNLPTMYKLERPAGETSAFSITYDKPQSPVESKEKITITATFTALTRGLFDEVFANKVFGMKNPLGFTVKALAKGVQLDFLTLKHNQSIPAPLAEPADTKFTGLIPDPKPIEPINFGSDVDIYERKQVTFVIRNLSAIAAPFKMSVKKFPVLDTTAVDLDGDNSSSSNQQGLLKPHEDGLNRFQSAGGKKYIGAVVQRQQDRVFLTSSLGCAYSISPAAGEVPPWGVRVVTIKTYNDMPGSYDDELSCQIVDNKQTKDINIPLKMNVRGCPIFIENNSFGLSTYRRANDTSMLGKQFMQLGHRCVNSDPMVREFNVRNNGSKAVKLKWRVSTLHSTAKGLVKVELIPSLDTTTSAGKVKVKLLFWSDITRVLPFRVEPEKCTILSYGMKSFKVTLFKTDTVGTETGKLIGTVDLTNDDEGALLSGSVSVDSIHSIKTSSAATSDAPLYTISLPLEGTLYYPSLRLDKHVFTAIDCPTLIDKTHGVKLKSHAPKLFSKDSKPSDVCSKLITLVNPLDSSLVFTVSIDGPFILKFPSDDTYKKQQLSSKQHLFSSTTATASKVDSSVCSSSLGKTYNLIPNASANFAVAYNPKKDTKEKLMNSTTATGSGNPHEDSGKVIITFSTGQSLHLPINASVSTPFITASSPLVFFGTCHTSKVVEGTILLLNPTNVKADWTVKHIPVPGGGKRASSIHVQGYAVPEAETDDPGVFDITPSSGSLEGPTVSVEAAIAVPPKDLNRYVDDPSNTAVNAGVVVVPQRLMESSWSSSSLTVHDVIATRHVDQHKNEADAFYPVPLVVKFSPKKNIRYSSRFRFTCRYGNSFDVVLEGTGTYNENEHKINIPSR